MADFPGASYDRWKTREDPSDPVCSKCGEFLEPDEHDERSRPRHPVMFCPNCNCPESPHYEGPEESMPVREDRRRGAQTRDTLEEADYVIVEGPIGKKGERKVLTKDRATGRCELWKENDNFVGYVLEIDGTGYQFARSVPKGTTHVSQIGESVISEKVTCKSDREAVEQAMQFNGTAVVVGGEFMVMSKEELAALEKSGVEFAYLYRQQYPPNSGEERVVSIPSTARWETPGVRTSVSATPKAPIVAPAPQAAPAPAPAPAAHPVQPESKPCKDRGLIEAKSMNRSMEELKDDVFEIGGWEVNDKAWDEGIWLNQATEAIVANRKNNDVMGRAIYAVPSKKEVLDVLHRIGVL